MTSKSRVAQEALTGLEKGSAPFKEQLSEAAKFIGSDLDSIRRSSGNKGPIEGRLQHGTAYGREEWLLRWLLKRLQAPKDDIPRRTELSWQILLHCIRRIPLPIVARIMVERKFMSILQQTLDDAKSIVDRIGSSDSEETSDSTAAEYKLSPKASKKRKRSGDNTEPSSSCRSGSRELLKSIYDVVAFVVISTKSSSGRQQEGRSVAFSAEYMNTVFRATAEVAGKLFGTWLIILGCSTILRDDKISWLEPFIEIWENHTTDTAQLAHFSLHCLLPLLSLPEHLTSKMEAQREELIARNVIIPAKAAFSENSSSTLLQDLSTLSVVRNPMNAAAIFSVAVRLTQTHASKRRRPNDESWLQHVFKTVQDLLPPKKSEENNDTVCALLQIAISSKVDLELPVLRSVTVAFVFPANGPEEWEGKNWELLSMVIKLDPNVFLIPNEEHDLLNEFFKRVNRASLQSNWSLNLLDLAVKESAILLMRAFAKARNLSGFIHHWLDQVVVLENLRESSSSQIHTYSVWEHELLHDELRQLLEASLTNQQISQLLDWLQERVQQNPEAVVLVLDAISGSIFKEAVVDAVDLRCYRIIFDVDPSVRLTERYRWRATRILTRTLSFLMPSATDELAAIWSARSMPIDFQSGSNYPTIFESPSDEMGLETLEYFRSACAAWSFARDGSTLQQLVKHELLRILKILGQSFVHFPEFLRVNEKAEKEWGIPKHNTSSRGPFWLATAYIRSLFVEHPQTLSLASQLEGNMFEELLRIIFWVASAGPATTTFAVFWSSALKCDIVLNNPTIIETMINIMLVDSTHHSNPLTNSKANNSFSISSLLELPSGILHRKYRERILTGWLPIDSTETSGQTFYYSTVMDPAVLALKVKVMQQPMFYKGMRFGQLVKLGDNLLQFTVKDSAGTSQVNNLLLKELFRLTIEFVLTIPDQPRSQEYIKDAFSCIQKKINKVHGRTKPKLDFVSISLFEIVLQSFAAKSDILDGLSLISKNDLNAIISSLQEILLVQLNSIGRELIKDKSNKPPQDTTIRNLTIISIIDALTAFGVDPSNLAEIKELANPVSDIADDSDYAAGSRLEAFISSHTENKDPVNFDKLQGHVSTISGRQSILKKASTFVEGCDNQNKLKLLKLSLAATPGHLLSLDKLLSIRHIVASLEDTRKRKAKAADDSDSDDSSDDEEQEDFDLSAAYAVLCNGLWKMSGKRQFCLTSEIMELVLKTKARSITQWNIDNTLSSIAIICSRNGPSIKTVQTGTIFLHLCHLLKGILSSHRLKLEGHFHVLIQALQVLLRCLFTPLPHSNAKTLKYYAPPPWLNANSTARLNSKHAAAFTRLITLICDPSVSSVTRSQHNNLTSATDKAKRIAGQHMQFVLATYIKLQLDMKMLPEIREKMIPGLYAIFDTTTPELRRCISDSLDSSGRAVFGMLYKDYLRFGKWKGS